MILSKEINGTKVEVIFDYSESCKNVYKTFSVYLNDKKSNVKGLKKFINNDLPEILTAKTFFWNPSPSADGRRRK